MKMNVLAILGLVIVAATLTVMGYRISAEWEVEEPTAQIIDGEGFYEGVFDGCLMAHATRGEEVEPSLAFCTEIVKGAIEVDALKRAEDAGRPFDHLWKGQPLPSSSMVNLSVYGPGRGLE